MRRASGVARNVPEQTMPLAWAGRKPGCGPASARMASTSSTDRVLGAAVSGIVVLLRCECSGCCLRRQRRSAPGCGLIVAFEGRPMTGPGGSTLCSLRLRGFGRVPAPAERFDQLDARANLEIHGLSQRELVGEEGPLGIDDDQVVHKAILVLRLREAQVVPGCADR